MITANIAVKNNDSYLKIQIKLLDDIIQKIKFKIKYICKVLSLLIIGLKQLKRMSPCRSVYTHAFGKWFHY
jgi:hypothetical protein